MVVSVSPDGSVSLPESITLSTPVRRILCALLDGALVIVTLGIGWFIWQFFTFGTGQTPAKKLMNMHVVSLNTGQTLPFWTMLLREWIVKSFIVSITFGIAYLWILWDPKKQTLYDKVLNTIVVDDPNKLLVAAQSVAPTTPSV